MFWATEEEKLRICISEVNLSSLVTLRILRELETSRSGPQKVNVGRGVLERLIVIECVLGFSFIPHVE